MATPWTQSLSINWRPELSFYDREVEILKAFEAKDTLRAFRVEEGFVDAQLFESRDRLKVRKDGIDLQLFSPTAEPDRALEALQLAIEEVQPTSPRNASASFQFVNALDLEFRSAVERGYGRILSAPQAGGVQFGDWAILSDFSIKQPPASGILEFGIIRDSEAPVRLARVAGRLRSGEDARAQQTARWEGETFPEVAVFVDAKISGVPMGDAKDLASDASGFWNAARAELSDFSETLRTNLLADNLGRVEAQ